MSMIALDFTPAEEAQILAAARRAGLAPAEYVKGLVRERLPAAAPPDPEEAREAEADFQELLHNLHRHRSESGERPLLS